MFQFILYERKFCTFFRITYIQPILTLTNFLTIKYFSPNEVPGDFVTNVQHIKSQSDLISKSSFAGPSYLTIRSFVYIILIWNPCILKLYNAKLDPVTYVGNLTSVHFISVNK